MFLRPATLVVTLPDTVDRRDLVGFGFHRAGEGLHLAATTAEDRQLSFAVSHFSGVGAARGTLDDLAALVSHLSETLAAQLSSEFAENFYGSQIAQLMAQDVRDPLAYQQVLREWLRVSLRVTISATLQESGVNQALLEYLAWKGAIGNVSAFLGVDFAAGMANDIDDVDRLMAGVLVAVGINGAQGRCFLAPTLTSDESALVHAQLSAANDAVEWFRILDGLGLAPLSTTTPTLASLLERLCVVVDPFDARVVPEDVAPGAFGELRVRAGLTFKDANLTPRMIVFAPPLDVQATATGTEEPIDGGPTDAQGIFHGAFRRFGDAPVAIAARACIVQAEFPHLRVVCNAADLTAGSTTTTSTSTMGAGGVQFNCCVENVSNCDFNFNDVTSRDALNAEDTRVRVRLLDQNFQQVFAPVHAAVALPPPPPLQSCPSCGRILGLDENGFMRGGTITYVTPPGSGTGAKPQSTNTRMVATPRRRPPPSAR